MPINVRLVYSSLHAYFPEQQVINSFPLCSSVMYYLWLYSHFFYLLLCPLSDWLLKLETLLHTFRMVSMCNQHYQWKIPTTLLALTSQEWRWACLLNISIQKLLPELLANFTSQLQLIRKWLYITAWLSCRWSLLRSTTGCMLLLLFFVYSLII